MIFVTLPLLVGASLLLSTHSSLDSDVLQFVSYVERFQRKYNEQEWTRRFQIFLKNKAKVAQLNAEQAGGEDVTFELDGPFADLTAEEFSLRLLPPRPSPHEEDATTNHVAGAPDAFDWREKGAVTRVKDQGALGTCWAFSTAQTLEGQLFISHGQLMDLSVEQLVECDASFDKETTNGDCGVFGGWPYLAFQYIIDAGGLRSDSEMPYCSGWNNKTQCWPCMPKGYSTIGCGDHQDFYCNATTTRGQGEMGLCDSKTGAAARVASWSHVSTDEEEIASVLTSVGPLSVLLNAQTLQFYRQGVWNPKWCNAEDLDHAVLLVGYGTDGGADYWTVKNSWGEKWGEQGYFRIMRGVGKCGINTEVTYALIE